MRLTLHHLDGTVYFSVVGTLETMQEMIASEGVNERVVAIVRDQDSGKVICAKGGRWSP